MPYQNAVVSILLYSLLHIDIGKYQYSIAYTEILCNTCGRRGVCLWLSVELVPSNDEFNILTTTKEFIRCLLKQKFSSVYAVIWNGHKTKRGKHHVNFVPETVGLPGLGKGDVCLFHCIFVLWN